MGKSKLAGAWGEALAAEYLRKHRYKILASGYRSRFGEIDLIAQNRKNLVFVEVKLRKSRILPRRWSMWMGRSRSGCGQLRRCTLHSIPRIYLPGLM